MPNSFRTSDVSATRSFDVAPFAHAAGLRRSRNAAALRAVFLRSSGPLLSFGWMLVGDRRVAEHLVEHAFLHVWRTRPDLGDESRLVPELYRSVVEAAFGRESVASGPNGGAGRANGSAMDDVTDRIRTALARLSFRPRAAFLLGRVPGLADSDIATWLGVPVARLKELVLEAAHHLIEELGECLDEVPDVEVRSFGSAARR